MNKARYNPIEDEGVNTIGLIFTKEFQWIFREQQKADMGIDAHVEVCENGNPLGRLIALQIKSGESWFREKTADGFIFRGSLEHLDYWQEHSLPVVIALYNPSNSKVFWQIVIPKFIKKTSKAWKISVPFCNQLNRSSLMTLKEYSKETLISEILKKTKFTKIGSYLEEELYKKILAIMQKIEFSSPKVEKETTEINPYQFIAFEVIKRLSLLGIGKIFCVEFYRWFMQENVATNTIRLVELGYQTFLIMDSEKKMAIWSAFDLADYIFMGAEKRKNPDVILCLNDIVNELFEHLGYERKEVTNELFYQNRKYIKNIEFVWDKALEESALNFSQSQMIKTTDSDC